MPDSIYRSLVQQAQDALLILDDTRFIDCNPSAERLYGTTCAAMRDTSLLDYSPSQQADGRDSLTVLGHHVQQALAGEPQRFAWLHCRADGSRFSANITLTRWTDGARVLILGVVRDISEHQRMQTELDAKSLEFQALLDNFPGGVSLIDSGLRLMAWNQEMIRLTDFPDAFFHAASPPVLTDLFRYNIARREYGDQDGMDDEQYLTMLTERTMRFQPHRFERTRPNGTVLEIRGLPMVNGGFVTIYQDITEQHQMKERLRYQSLLLHEVLEHMPAGITVFDEHLRLQLWNTGVMEMLDLPPKCMVKGVAFEDLLRIMLERGEYGVCDVEQEIHDRMAIVRKFKEHRYERTSPNGRTFLIHGKPLYSDGKLLEFITTLTEITDRKQAEMTEHEANLRLEQLVKELREARADLIRSEKLATLGSLVAGVAHELNTPLGNCLMMASTLQDMTSSMSKKVQSGSITRADLTDYMSEATDASCLIMRNLSSAAELIMHFKQVAIDEASSQRGSFNLNQLVQESISVLHNKLHDAGHRIELSIPPEIEMDSYPGPIEQVIANLVTNAIMHAFDNRSGGNMRLSAKVVQEGRVVIEFQDDGAGIPEHHLSRIFDPFFTTKPGQGGTGLGLSISYNIVTSLLGGEISATSSLGHGTRFTLDLPLQAPLHHCQ
jgi:PAS domain S-box-containing protein